MKNPAPTKDIGPEASVKPVPTPATSTPSFSALKGGASVLPVPPEDPGTIPFLVL